VACDTAAFTSARGHLNPDRRKHGFDSKDGPHDGDLPNIVVGRDSTARAELVLMRARLDTNSLLDADGSALVIHAGADDHRTDPSGNSGGRVACAAITRRER
jgi:superoxide dismutase, Cu-Zn family